MDSGLPSHASGFFLEEHGGETEYRFFLHIPFPTPGYFHEVAVALELIQALIDYDLVGFQTIQDRRNFVGCLQRLMPDARVEGRGAVVTVHAGNRKFRLGAFPISIDYNQFSDLAKRPDVARKAFELKEALRHRRLFSVWIGWIIRKVFLNESGPSRHCCGGILI